MKSNTHAISRVSVERLESRIQLAASLTLDAFRDANHDGVRQASEPRMESMFEFWIRPGTPDNLGQDDYRFRVGPGEPRTPLSLPAGTYTISSFMFGGIMYLSNTTDDKRVVTLADNATTSLDIGVAFFRELASKYFYDFDGDGQRTGNDSPDGSLKVFLDSDRDGVLDTGEQLATNFYDGLYAFGRVRAGVQRVVVQGSDLWHTAAVDVDAVDDSALKSISVLKMKRSGLNITGRVGSYAGLTAYYEMNSAADALVYLDLNRNTVPDVGEPQTMAQRGYFAFNDLAAGSYMVRIVPSGDLVQTFPHEAQGIEVSVSQANPAATAIFAANLAWPKAWIELSSFYDVDGNGILSSEYEDVRPTFYYSDLNNNGTFENSEPWANFGNDLQVDPGTHLIRTAIPDNASYTNVSTFTTNVVAGEKILLPLVGYWWGNMLSGNVYEDNALHGQDTDRPAAGVHKVYADLNANGVLDAGEPSVQADANGGWQLTHLPDGLYNVRVTLNAGETVTSPLDGAYTVRFRDGKPNLIEPRFGIATSSAIDPAKASFEGVIFCDVNEDGVRDASEGVMAHHLLFLDRNNDKVFDDAEPWAYTDQHGRFAFYNLPAGTATMRTADVGSYLTSAGGGFAVTVQVGKRVVGVSAGFHPGIPIAGVSGVFYNDMNGNGVQDPTEPGMPDQEVMLVQQLSNTSSQLLGVTRTDAFGRYFLYTDRIGETSVRFELPLGWDPAERVYGVRFLPVELAFDEARSSDYGFKGPNVQSSGVTGQISVDAQANTISPQMQMTVMAAIAPTSAGLPARTVYADLNANGNLDNGEPTTITDTNGNFVLEHLAVGRHAIRQLLPSGWAQSLPASNAPIDVTIGSSTPVVKGLRFGASYGAPGTTSPSSVTIQSESATLSGGTGQANNHTGYTGTGFADYAGQTSSVTYSLTRTSAGTATPVDPPPVDPPPGSDTDLAQGKATTSSSNESAALSPDKATDGNAATRWASSFADNQWIRVDLGAATVVGGVTLHWEAAFGKSYKIQGSADGSNWTDLYSTTAGDGGVDNITITNTTAWRYVRMLGITRGTKYGFSLFAFNVNAAGTVTPPPVDPPPVDPPPAGAKGSISGVVWTETDADGVREAGESLLSGKIVFIDLDRDGVQDSNEPTSTTNAAGVYTFKDLAAGNYRVGRAKVSGYWFVNPLSGFHDITLAAGQVITTADIGTANKAPSVTPPPPPPTGTTGSISGVLFMDANKNGLFDGSDYYLKDKVVFIDLDGDNSPDSNEKQFVSDANGKFTFTGLSAGTYKIRRVVPAGYKQTSPLLDVVLTAGQNVNGLKIITVTV